MELESLGSFLQCVIESGFTTSVASLFLHLERIEPADDISFCVHVLLQATTAEASCFCSGSLVSPHPQGFLQPIGNCIEHISIIDDADVRTQLILVYRSDLLQKNNRRLRKPVLFAQEDMRRKILALVCAGDCGDYRGRAVLVEVV